MRNELARPKPWPKREGLGYELSFFDGGSGLANKEGLAKTPLETQARLSIRTGDVNPFRTQLSVDGQTSAYERNRSTLGSAYRKRTVGKRTLPPPPSDVVARHRKYESRIPRTYPAQRLQKPWQPISRRIAQIPSVKVLGGHSITGGQMGLRPQPIFKTVQQNLQKLRLTLRNAVTRIRARR